MNILRLTLFFSITSRILSVSQPIYDDRFRVIQDDKVPVDLATTKPPTTQPPTTKPTTTSPAKAESTAAFRRLLQLAALCGGRAYKVNDPDDDDVNDEDFQPDSSGSSGDDSGSGEESAEAVEETPKNPYHYQGLTLRSGKQISSV
ncbi:Oidioi.mRNA.OKI2018_I69.YSR.g17156.t1.cds [Oikopleura dioica]|uniref:Oidioi.mRNA.OKI2018_I69.YSR.g17156.t1.cds n=1 Tax=Oikopleura dioica TaxID=34765 RepID=A0ABN7SIC6_OIKDI|nr:Oidioi.mRNA.OKI2018_I69.YSR.g17156.t1.cds [Oikopleura dioica]